MSTQSSQFNSTRCRIFDRCAVSVWQSEQECFFVGDQIEDSTCKRLQGSRWVTSLIKRVERKEANTSSLGPPANILSGPFELPWLLWFTVVELLRCCLRRITVKHRWLQSKAALSWNLLAPSEYPPFSLAWRNKCSSLTVWVFLQK